MFEDEAALIPSLRGSEVTDLVAKVTEGEETAVAEALALLEPGTPEDEKDRVTKVRSRTGCGGWWYVRGQEK